MQAYPELQERLEGACVAAIERGFYRPQDGLPEDSFSDEYLAYGLDIFYPGGASDVGRGKPPATVPARWAVCRSTRSRRPWPPVAEFVPIP